MTIKAYKLEEIAAAKAETPLAALEDRAREAPDVRPFAETLLQATKTGYGLIAEIKKASPSKGLIRDPISIRRRWLPPTRRAVPPACRS